LIHTNLRIRWRQTLITLAAGLLIQASGPQIIAILNTVAGFLPV
jgi:hypothetical protein